MKLRSLISGNLVALCIVPVVHAAADPYQSSVTPALSVQVGHAREQRLNGQPQPAIQSLEPIVQAHPDYFLARYNLGLAYTAMNRLPDAITELEAAQQLNLKFGLHEPTIENALGSLYLSAGKYKEAVTVLQLAAAPAKVRSLDDAARGKVFNNLGLAYARTNSPCEANASYDIAKSATAGRRTDVADDLSGIWVVTLWKNTDRSVSIRRNEATVTGWLQVNPKGSTGLSDGRLSLCVLEPRALYSYGVIEDLTIKDTNGSIQMDGHLKAGLLNWVADRIVVSRSDGALVGMAYSPTRYSSEKDNIRFDKLW